MPAGENFVRTAGEPPPLFSGVLGEQSSHSRNTVHIACLRERERSLSKTLRGPQQIQTETDLCDRSPLADGEGERMIFGTWALERSTPNDPNLLV